MIPHAPDNAALPAMVSHDPAGTRVLTAVAPIAALDWRVFVDQPVAGVHARRDAVSLRTGLRLGADMGVAVLAALALARNMMRPIRTLDEGARCIGQGALPGGPPIEQPTQFERVIKLKTAQAMGVKVPQCLPLQADEVIR